MFEERRNLLRTMRDRRSNAYLPSAVERAAEAAVHIERIREMLKVSEVQTPEVAPK
jgi:hypothetical protein